MIFLITVLFTAIKTLYCLTILIKRKPNDVWCVGPYTTSWVPSTTTLGAQCCTAGLPMS